MRTKASSSDSAAGAQIGERARGDDAAVVMYGHAIAEALHHFEHMRREENGGAAPLPDR